MYDYNAIGLNRNLRSINGPGATPPDMTGMSFDYTYEVQTKRIRTSQISAKSFIFNSASASAAGTFGTGDSVTITYTLSPDVNYTTAVNLGIPSVAIYEGTAAVGSLQYFPRYGNGISNGRYRTSGGFSYPLNNGTNTVYQITVENINAGAQNIFVIGDWRYIQEQSGASSNS